MTERVRLAHGNGGRCMRELIEEVFARAFGDEAPDTRCDAAAVPPTGGPLMVTTDGFTVQPLEFPGGDLGSLAVHGSVNDLAVAGAEPRWLTLAAVLEEGLPLATLQRLAGSFAASARAAGVRVLAGDTKVVPRGHGGGAYFMVSALGERVRAGLGLGGVQAGDALLVSGPVGDHGVAVLLAREDFDLRGDLRSDCAPVLPLCRALWPLDGLRFLRDPTRGGLATVAHEIAAGCKLGVHLIEGELPVRDSTRSVCEMLGFDPLFLACEGRAVAVVAAAQAAQALAAWQALDAGRQAAIIGQVRPGPPQVVLHTTLGGERVLDELDDDPLPRIC
jgi:hydrogenase expression/formation protein HypE